jgi:hypothetical protein
MNHSNFSITFKNINKICFGLVLFALPLSSSFAQAGCCSRHGGVAGCNAATGHQQCKDGSDSPSCSCSGTKTTATKAVKVTPKTKPAQAPATHAKTTATPMTPVPKAKTTGCCARHGGVSKCNKSSGYQMCKDGTQSSTCTCP